MAVYFVCEPVSQQLKIKEDLLLSLIIIIISIQDIMGFWGFGDNTIPLVLSISTLTQ
jgi:hypothetical protein